MYALKDKHELRTARPASHTDDAHTTDDELVLQGGRATHMLYE